MEILGLLNQQLVKLLECIMPVLDSDWWNSLVLEKLTYQQKTFASSLPTQALERLDLAALLRVADQNWYDIASQGDFNRETRNWLKEAQSIRNRWAHAPAEGLPDDVRYRDIDTIERLLLAFGTDSQTFDALLSKEAENRYQVFHDGNISTYYESQIEVVTAKVTRTSITPDVLPSTMIAVI